MARPGIPSGISATAVMTSSRSQAKSTIEPRKEAGADLTRMSYTYPSLFFWVLFLMVYNRCLYLNPLFLKREVPHKGGKRSQKGCRWHRHYRRRCRSRWANSTEDSGGMEGTEGCCGCYVCAVDYIHSPPFTPLQG